MTWMTKAQLAIATDLTMSVEVARDGSLTQRSVDDRIQDVAADIIASDPTVADAAAAAVDAKVDGLDILTGDQQRAPRNGVADSFRIRDADGRVAFEVRPDGTTWAASLSGGSDGNVVTRVVLIAMMGQSNAVAHAQPYGPRLDPADSRIWQLPYGGTTLIPATVPLAAQGVPDGLSASHVLAREIVNRSTGTAVVIVPAAKGATGLVADAEFGVWAIDYAGANPKMYENAIDMMDAALTQIDTVFGVTPEIIATWIQGENDGSASISRAAYEAALDALIGDFRTRYGSDIPFLIGGLNPQYATFGTLPQIVLAHQDTPRRMEGCAYIPGVNNGGGSRGPADLVHYSREAIETIGKGFHAAYPRAVNNTATSHTTPPLVVDARRFGDVVTVTWTPPYSRVTTYELETSPDGSTWTAATLAEPLQTSLAITSATPVLARVRAVGVETSAWTKPIGA